MRLTITVPYRTVPEVSGRVWPRRHDGGEVVAADELEEVPPAEDAVVELVEAGAVAHGGPDVGGHVSRALLEGQVEEAARHVQHPAAAVHAVANHLEKLIED